MDDTCRGHSVLLKLRYLQALSSAVPAQPWTSPEKGFRLRGKHETFRSSEDGFARPNHTIPVGKSLDEVREEAKIVESKTPIYFAMSAPIV